MLRKMLLVVSAMAALAAFAMPAAAQAEEWHVNGKAQTETKQTKFGAGISETIFGFTVGIEIYFYMSTDNISSTANGAVVSAERFPQSTNLPGCAVELATNSTEASETWPVMGTGEHGISISNIEVTNYYSSGCAKYGIPSETTHVGTLTATYNNETECLEMEKAGDLTTTGGGVPVLYSGQLCNEEEYSLTLE